jgi:hypothetical protein
MGAAGATVIVNYHWCQGPCAVPPASNNTGGAGEGGSIAIGNGGNGGNGGTAGNGGSNANGGNANGANSGNANG